MIDIALLIDNIAQLVIDKLIVWTYTGVEVGNIEKVYNYIAIFKDYIQLIDNYKDVFVFALVPAGNILLLPALNML